MSRENDEAVKIYRNPEYAKKYIKGGLIKAAQDPDHAKAKSDRWHDFFLRNLDGIPDNTLLEIGAGPGEDSVFFKETGYDVTGSDVSPHYVQLMKKNGVKAIELNVVNDEIPGKYSAVLAWRMMVHLSPEDIEVVMPKVYAALKEGGRFICNLFNRKEGEPKYKKVDFDGPYHMGIERPYFYHTEQEINAIIKKTSFKIKSFHMEGGDDGKKWLVYVLEK